MHKKSQYIAIIAVSLFIFSPFSAFAQNSYTETITPESFSNDLKKDICETVPNPSGNPTCIIENVTNQVKKQVLESKIDEKLPEFYAKAEQAFIASLKERIPHQLALVGSQSISISDTDLVKLQNGQKIIVEGVEIDPSKHPVFKISPISREKIIKNTLHRAKPLINNRVRETVKKIKAVIIDPIVDYVGYCILYRNDEKKLNKAKQELEEYLKTVEPVIKSTFKDFEKIGLEVATELAELIISEQVIQMVISEGFTNIATGNTSPSLKELADLLENAKKKISVQMIAPLDEALNSAQLKVGLFIGLASANTIRIILIQAKNNANNIITSLNNAQRAIQRMTNALIGRKTNQCPSVDELTNDSRLLINSLKQIRNSLYSYSVGLSSNPTTNSNLLKRNPKLGYVVIIAADHRPILLTIEEATALNSSGQITKIIDGKSVIIKGMAIAANPSNLLLAQIFDVNYLINILEQSLKPDENGQTRPQQLVKLCQKAKEAEKLIGNCDQTILIINGNCQSSNANTCIPTASSKLTVIVSDGAKSKTIEITISFSKEVKSIADLEWLIKEALKEKTGKDYSNFHLLNDNKNSCILEEELFNGGYLPLTTPLSPPADRVAPACISVDPKIKNKAGALINAFKNEGNKIIKEQKLTEEKIKIINSLLEVQIWMNHSNNKVVAGIEKLKTENKIPAHLSDLFNDILVNAKNFNSQLPNLINWLTQIKEGKKAYDKTHLLNQIKRSQEFIQLFISLWESVGADSTSPTPNLQSFINTLRGEEKKLNELKPAL